MKVKDLFYALLQNYKHNKSDRDYQSFIALLLYAILGSLIYSIVFLLTGFHILSALIFICFLAFLVSAYFFDRGKTMSALTMAFISISVSVNVSVLFAGLDCGAHFYLLSSAILFFLTEIFKKPVAYFFAILSLAEYFIIQFGFLNVESIYTISETVIVILRQINTIAAFGAVAFVSISYRSAVKHYENELRTLNDETLYLANYDQLTGLVNRHYLYQKLDWIIKESNDNNSTFVIGMADIDNFKAINDQFGHLYGDAVLKETSQKMKHALRKNDIVGRWGGEEFLIILANTEIESGLSVLERVRCAVSTVRERDSRKAVEISVTIGAAAYESNMPASDLLNIADKCLYRGKQQGKNLVMGN